MVTKTPPIDGVIAGPRELGSLTLRAVGRRARPRTRRSAAPAHRAHHARGAADRARPACRRAADAAAIAAYADPSPFIESDDPAIVTLAHSIVGDEQDPVVAARKLVDCDREPRQGTRADGAERARW
jgi:hypothetical protein